MFACIAFYAFRSALLASQAVVGINTTAMIEAAILRRPVLSVRDASFVHSQRETIHFGYLAADAGGCALVADSLEHPAAEWQTFELGGPETLRMRDIIAVALRVANIHRPIVPGPAPLLKLATLPLTMLTSPPLTPDAIDFINQPATVDLAPLLARMPRRLTPLDEGLRTYLAPDSGPATIRFETLT